MCVNEEEKIDGERNIFVFELTGGVGGGVGGGIDGGVGGGVGSGVGLVGVGL